MQWLIRRVQGKVVVVYAHALVDEASRVVVHHAANIYDIGLLAVCNARWWWVVYRAAGVEVEEHRVAGGAAEVEHLLQQVAHGLLHTHIHMMSCMLKMGVTQPA